MGDERRADAAFVHIMFVLTERRVARVRPREAVAVVRVRPAGHHAGALPHHAAIASAFGNHARLQFAAAHGLEHVRIFVLKLNAFAAAHSLGAAAVVGEE